MLPPFREGCTPVRAIHSGGQSGADQGGLAAAVVLGLGTGGWAPKGYSTESGAAPWLASLGLREHSSSGYRLRTQLNVKETDGTLIFGRVQSPGSHLTWQTCESAEKPFRLIPWSGPHCNFSPPLHEIPDFLSWLDQHKIRTLNVAGNRETKNPGIRDAVRLFLVAALESA